MPDYSTRTSGPTTSTTGSGVDGGGPELDPQALVGNQAVVDIIKAENHYTGERAFDPSKTAIVHMGMNGYAADEARHLNSLNRDRGGAIGIRQRGTAQDEVTHLGTKFDLTQVEDCARYVATLGLPDQTAVDVAQALNRDDFHEARDELAQLVRVLSEAELGARRMDRLVLSGHSVGTMIWGDDNGNIHFDDLAELLQYFPKATGQVTHLMLSACYTGGERKLAQYHAMFPNLQSIWAYDGSSPGTWSGAMDHMTAWESSTEPGKDASGVDPTLAAGTRKADNVSTWNTTDGYQGDQPMSLWDLRRQLEDQVDSVYMPHLSGEQTVTDSQSGPLREFYNLVQRYLSHPDASGGELARYQGIRDTTIRLLYWGLVTRKFADAYGTRLTAGYAAVERALPAFASMSRLDAAAEVDAFSAAADAMAMTGDRDAAVDDVLDLLERGLVELDATLVPTQWL
ncbi:MAG: hypothetical protein H6742_08625 [Alphaproteobacteria bacterium]|nr:hypothetical protein [Alphaproteobacteria bacterium]